MNATALVLDQLSILSDATRVRMLTVLERRELTVSELCEVVQLPQSTVSRHLKTLADGGWVTSRRDGTSRLYTLTIDELESSARQLWQVVRDQVATSSAASEDSRRLKHVLVARRSKSEEFFSSTAGQWDRLRMELFGGTSAHRALGGLLDPSATVGDLGCGTGHISEWLSPFVRRVIAVDASKEMLRAASGRLSGLENVDVRQGSLERLPISDGELDVALLLLVLHHLAEPEGVLLEAARTLKPGGLLLIQDMVPHDREDYRQTMGHVWLGFSDKQVRRWLVAAGFERIRFCELPPEAKAKGPSLFVVSARTVAAKR